MPLITITGLPCCGKSKRAKELKEYFESQHSIKVSLVSENDLMTDKNAIASDSQQEKVLRGRLKSDSQRTLDSANLVIIDASNYIKGYRYELYCMSKSAKSTQCVVHLEASVDQILDWNRNRQPVEESYGEDVLRALVDRYEPPDSRNRWDSPLFVVLPDDQLPFDDIHGALFKNKAPKPNQSTQSQPLSASNYLYELDESTRNVINVILSQMKVKGPGDEISIPGCEEKFVIRDTLTLAKLKQKQRQFISFCKTHPSDFGSNHVTSFVHYLNGNW